MSTDTETHSLRDESATKALQRVDEAVCALDDEWQFTFVNDQAAAMLEHTPEELLGANLWETVPAIEGEQIGEKLRHAMETQRPVRFDSYADTAERWFKVRIYPTEGGLTACFYDITDERGDQLDLQRKRRLFETVFDETEDALVVADTDRRITEFNPAAERLFGYDASEVVGEKAEILYADPDDYERQGEQRFNVNAPERDETYITEYARADGTTFEGETLGTSLKGPDGKTLAFLGSIRDISARVEYQQTIEARNDTLRTFHEISTDEERGFDEQVEALLELGRTHFGLDVGLLSNHQGQECAVEHVSASDGTIEQGDRFAVSENYCDRIAEEGELFAVTGRSGQDEPDGPNLHEQTPTYIGAPVVVEGELYGTLNFSGEQPRQKPFSESERTLVRVFAQWVGKELSRQRSSERAAANRERLRQIIDMLPQLVFAKDRDGEFLLANQAIADAYGTTVEELEGATDADFAESKEEAKQFREDDIAVIDSGEPKQIPEEPLTTADGEELVLQTTKIPYDPVDHEKDAVLGVATDITSLKERDAEIELQAEAMEASMDGIAVLDDGEYVYMNQSHADIFGYDPEELLGSEWQQLYGEQEVERLEEEVFPVLAEDGEWRGETVGHTRDGTAVNQEITLSLLDDGKLICTNRDITEQKRREQELERQRTRLRALFDKSPDGIVVHDAEGTILDVNETVTETLGYGRETLLSMNVSEFESGIDRAELKAVWNQLEEGDTLKIEGEHERKDGETFPVEVWVNKVDVNGSERFIAVDRDITDRKAREAELKRSRDFIEKAQESASIGGWEVDLTAETVTWTDEVYRIHDLPTDADVSLDDGFEFYHPKDRATIRDAFDRLTTDGEPYDLELRIVTADDRVRWVRAVGDPQFDDDGAVVGVRGIFQEITERRQREQELRDVKERLDLAVEGAKLGIWDWDMDTDAVTFNEQWAAMLGFSLEELDGHIDTWEQRVHPADMERVEQKLDAHIAGEAELYDCEHRMQTKDGDWKWIRDVGKVVERDSEGNPSRAVGIHLDITDQKQSELALEEERDMFASGPAVVFKWETGEGWPVEYVSENVTETFGYTPEQLQSGEVPYTDLVHDDDIERVANEVETQSDGTTDRFSHEPYRMITASGETRWVTDNTKIVRTDGEITHYLGYLIDITEQKRLEATLRESERSLRELTDIASGTEREFDEKLAALLELGTERLGLPYGFLTRIDDETQRVVQAVGSHPQLQTGAVAPKSESYCRKTIQQDSVLDIQDAAAEGWDGDPAYERFDLGCYIGETVVVDGDQYGTLCFADQASRDHAFSDTERAFVELLVQWVSYELTSDAFETKLQEMNDTARQLMAAPSREEIAAITVESAKSVLDMPENGVWWYDESTDTLVPECMTAEADALFSEQPTLEQGNSLAYDAFQAGEIRVYDDLGETDGLYDEQTDLQAEVIVPFGEYGLLSAGSTDQQAFSETDQSLLEVLSATVEAALGRAERESVLRETQRKLKQSNEELEQFAYAASHDLQEPLRTVSSYLTLLERRYGDELDDDATEFIDFAVDGADRMRKMIQALLAYSRVDTRGQSFESVDVPTLFERVTDNLKLTIEETDATVTTPTADLSVTGDPSQLVQMFQNLVENGIKYNTDTPRVDIRASHDDGMVTFEVTDNGIGMEDGQTDEIFEVFQRLHTREEFDGTGIGLSICRKVVDRHGGQISVESAPGEGSTFTVTLPGGTDIDD
ncbi:PAS domain S-box protein [Salinibaculum rarum]|uniref:PAS domain S-box protein n=1 Tax=Salinibaculum rarum TaxID=3058903 RepID=UPI00265FE9CB|nr:PAS domain S-box protein [Salinibaculum sp. KK48]